MSLNWLLNLKDVMTSDPEALLRTIVLPVDEVLENGPDPVDHFLICNFGRRKYLVTTRLCGGRQQRFRVRFKEIHMERR